MSRSRSTLIGLCLVLAGCSADDDSAVTSPDPAVLARPATAPFAPDPDRARNERHARRLAAALRDGDFRSSVLRAITESKYRESRIHYQAFLHANENTELRRVAALAGEAEGILARDVAEGPSLELYFPVPEHRQRWLGGTDLLVATAERDGDSPVAFDLLGRRFTLDPAIAPATPVLIIARSELRFDAGPSAMTCFLDCDGGAGTGGGGTAAPGLAGLYLTGTRFSGTFESWFKGNPEFEVHVLGQAGSTAALQSYQCAGEHAGGAYSFDQNTTAWTGSVLLFSQAQLDQYRAEHPGKNIRILVLEDDDTACQIKVDSTRVTRLLTQLNGLYGNLTGGIDSLVSLQKIFKAASVLSTVYDAAAAFFKTNDDLVGNAVEDPAAAAGFLTGARWVVKGEYSASAGALRIEMR